VSLELIDGLDSRLLYAEVGDLEGGSETVSTWPCWVVHKHGRYAIHAAYYGEDGEIWTCSEEPVYPEGMSLQELGEYLDVYRAALERPVLEYSELWLLLPPSQTCSPLLAKR
jgi:hypothetical protein